MLSNTAFLLKGSIEFALPTKYDGVEESIPYWNRMEVAANLIKLVSIAPSSMMKEAILQESKGRIRCCPMSSDSTGI